MRVRRRRIRQAGGYGRPKQIVVQVLISTRRKAQRRKGEWSKARTTYVGGDTEVAIEIESTLSFPPVETIAVVAKIGISTEDCRACFVLTAGWPSSADLGNEH